MVQIFTSLAVLSIISACSCASYNIDYNKIMRSVPSGSIDSSIFSNHHLTVNKVQSTIEGDEIPMIVIDSNAVPIKMLFKTASASLDIKQEHENAAPNTQETTSVDGEIVLKHTVKKPIVQYVYEEIVPSRFLTQKIEPVKEYVKTIVSKNEASSHDAESSDATNSGDTNQYVYEHGDKI